MGKWVPLKDQDTLGTPTVFLLTTLVVTAGADRGCAPWQPHQVRKKGTSAGQVDVCLGFNTANGGFKQQRLEFFLGTGWCGNSHIFGNLHP